MKQYMKRFMKRCLTPNLALTMVIAGGVGLSAHRMDEYLQAARIAIDPGRAEIELDLTPGIALADSILADIDRNRDGSLSAEEQRTYGSLVLSALELDVDGARLPLELGASSFPETGAVKRGEGTIRLHLAAALPPLSAGVHHLLFRNRHHPARSVYLANALVPQSYRVVVTGQQRDVGQTELTIDYVLSAAPAGSRTAWLLGAVAVAIVLSALLMRQLR
jgi:hypothetical protein